MSSTEISTEIKVRKWCQFEEETLTTESGMSADGNTLIRYAIAVVFTNPYAGRQVESLDEAIAASVSLGEEFARRIALLAAGREIQSYGKACIVGVQGEYEHGNAFLTTEFAEPVRAAVQGGKAWISSTGKRASLGAHIDVPLAHKDALYVRSNYDTYSLYFPDAPAPDEIVLICVFATRGRLRARLGGLCANEIQGTDGLY